MGIGFIYCIIYGLKRLYLSCLFNAVPPKAPYIILFTLHWRYGNTAMINLTFFSFLRMHDSLYPYIMFILDVSFYLFFIINITYQFNVIGSIGQ